MSIKRKDTNIKLVDSIKKGESKEEKVAKITSKNALIGIILAALIGSPILLKIVDKQFESQNKPDEREIHYFDEAKTESNEQFKNNEMALVKSKEQVDSAILNADSEEFKRELGEIKTRLENMIESNRNNRKSFNEYAVRSMDALKNGERASAAALRRSANSYVDAENQGGLHFSKFASESELFRIKSEFNKIVGRDNGYITLKDLGTTWKAEWNQIRGINQTEPKKTMDEITENFAEKEVKDSDEHPKDISIAAAAP